jgi:transposase-like protein
MSSTGCTPEHVVTDKASFYPSVIRTCAPDAKHTATGFYNLVVSTNRCERSHGYVKSRLRPMRGLKSFACATRLFPALDALQLIERDFVRVPPVWAPCIGGRSYVRARHIAAVFTRLGQTL